MIDDTRNKPPLYLDMEFEEALGRFMQTDPEELKRNKEKRRKKAGGTRPPAREKGGPDCSRKRGPPRRD